VLAEKKDLSVPEYERRLKDRVALLELVKGSFSVSYDLLTPLRKKNWRRLSVFPEDFDREAATSVLKMDPDASAEALSDLVCWSLLNHIEEPDSKDGRYQLHDLARIFAESCLNGDESADARLKHATHYSKVLSRCDELYQKGGTNTLAGLKLFDREWSIIRVGQNWANNEIQNSSKLKKNDLKSILQLESYYAAEGAKILDLRLHPRERIIWIECGLRSAKMMWDQGAQGVHLGNLGLAYADLGETDNAMVYYEQALDIARKIGDKRGEGNQLSNIGRAYADLGDTRKSIEYLEHALNIALEIGDRWNEGNQLGNLGIAYTDLGDIRKSIDYLEHALNIAREIGDRRGEGNQLSNLGRAYANFGDMEKSIDYLENALNIAQNLGDKRGEGNAFWNISLTYDKL
jgi:tetratricopeptide (TPR) repeat protein